MDQGLRKIQGITSATADFIKPAGLFYKETVYLIR